MSVIPENGGVRSDIFDQTDSEGSISEEDLAINGDQMMSECSVSPVSNFSAHSHISGRTPSSSIPSSSRAPSRLSQMTKEQIISDSEDPVFITKPQSQLYCGVCGRVMRRPVISQCGHTCCGGCVMFGEKTCPLCGTKLSTFVENIAMRDQIGALQVYCKFGCAMAGPDGRVYTGQGCTDKLLFSERKSHEAQCPWSIVSCPNSKQCGSLLARDLTEHLIVCQHAKCENSLYGCDFVGTSAAVDDHEEDCKFFVVRGIIGTFQTTMDAVVKQVREQGKQISELRDELRSLRAEALAREHAPRDVDTLHSKVLSEHKLAIAQIRKEMGSIQTELGMVDGLENQVYKCKGTFVGHTGPVFAMASSGNLLFTGSGDGTIKVWETMYNPSCVETLLCHEDQVLSLCVSETSLFSASADKTLVQWDLKTYAVLRSTSLNKAISKMATSDKYLFTGSHKFINVWHKETLGKYSVMEELSHWVRALSVKEDRLYTGVHATVIIWNAISLEKLNTVEVRGVVYSIVVTDSWLVCGTKESLEMRSLRDPINDFTLLSGGNTRADFSTVYCLDYTESGGYTRLFSGNSDSIKVWNLDRKIQCQTLDRHQGTIACLSVLKGKLYSGGYDHTVKVWRGSKIG